jgi:hypothetical protein
MIQNNQIWKNQSDFSPHFGLAWDLTGKGTTVVRGGGYVAYMIPMLISFVAAGSTATSEDYGSEPTGAILYQANGATIAPIGDITSGFVHKIPLTNSSGIVTGGLPWTAGSPIFSSPTPVCGDGLPQTAPGNPAILNPPTCTATGGTPNIYTGYRYYGWNLNVQHAFTNNLSLDVGYVGSHSADIPEFYDINQALPGSNVSSAEQTRRPFFQQFPWFANIVQGENIGGGSYNSLQMLLKERTSHGFTFQGSYTLSHGLAQGGVTNPAAPKLDYGSLAFDALHHVAITASYAIPGRKSPGGILEGWGLNFSVNAVSGLPINASDSKFDTAGTGNGAERWSLYGPATSFDQIIGGSGGVPCFTLSTGKFNNGSCVVVAAAANFPQPCIAGATAEGTSPNPNAPAGSTGLAQLAALGCYSVNGSAIVPPAQGTFGNMTFDELRGKATIIENASVTKDVKIMERLNAQFKVEAFNLFNTTDYAASQAGLGSPGTFGRSLSTPDVSSGASVTGSGAPRDIQLSLRLSW